MPFKIQKGKSWNNLSKQSGDGLGKAAKSVGKGVERTMNKPFDFLSDFTQSPSFLVIAGIAAVGLVVVMSSNNSSGSVVIQK
jgi:hypothetical protein